MSSEGVDVTRRSFLRGNALTSEGRARDAKIRNPLGPPPPWLGEILDQDKCSNCTQPCITSCQPGIIKIHPDNHLLSSLPYLDFGRNGCTYCGDCTEACPEFTETIQKDQPPFIGKITLDKDKCHAWNGVFCMSCIGRCEVSALALNQRRQLEVDTDLCNGCGNCIRTCPADALTVSF